MDDVITIDGAGRLVVPQAMRARLRLHKGSRLRVRLEQSRIVLEPLAEDGVPVEVDGVLVIRGRLADEIPDHRTLREERISALSGKR
jgi:AbrB family looped-hinge helix DNA binding protein